jgi:capsular polysaccharide biosynthesis protein
MGTTIFFYRKLWFHLAQVINISINACMCIVWSGQADITANSFSDVKRFRLFRCMNVQDIGIDLQQKESNYSSVRGV